MPSALLHVLSMCFPYVRYCCNTQSQRREKDLCYYGFNILRAREQLMVTELFFLFVYGSGYRLVYNLFNRAHENVA